MCMLPVGWGMSTVDVNGGNLPNLLAKRFTTGHHNSLNIEV